MLIVLWFGLLPFNRCVCVCSVFIHICVLSTHGKWENNAIWIYSTAQHRETPEAFCRITQLFVWSTVIRVSLSVCVGVRVFFHLHFLHLINRSIDVMMALACSHPQSHCIMYTYILHCLPIHVFPHRGLWSFYKIMELPLIISYPTIVSIMMISKWIKWQSFMYDFFLLFHFFIFRSYVEGKNPHEANVRRKFVINSLPYLKLNEK